jgi:ribosome-binding factor A
MEGHRVGRIEEQLRIELNDIVEGEIQDPRIGLVTVTAVKVSPDLRHARVFVSILGDAQERKRTMQGLNSAANYARRELSQRLHHLRRIPELTFAYDDSVETGTRIDELLDQIKPHEE